MEMTSSPAGSPTDDWCVHHFDPQSPELAPELPATLARMRAICPVAHSDQYGGFWVVTKYADVLRVAEEWETFSSEHGLLVPPAPTAVRNMPVEADPPVHRTYKRLVNAYLTPAAVQRWEDRTRHLVSRLIDVFIEQGRCDFMAEFARPYPALAFFDFTLNAPEEELEKLAYLTSKSALPTDPESAACWAALADWVRDFIAQRRNQDPKGDLVDGVLAAEIDGRTLTEEEVIGTIQNLVIGGLKTTSTALGMMMIRFCRQPEIPALLRQQPEMVSKAVEELLRLDPPVSAVGRTAISDCEVGGQHIKPGDKIMMYWSSADRDEDEFPDPDTFDLGRTRNRHVTLGAGVHRCAGSNLARMNLRIALGELLSRLDDIQVEDEAELHYSLGVVRGLVSLPITFTPRRRLAESVVQVSEVPVDREG
jgi:cytochrome P450